MAPYQVTHTREFDIAFLLKELAAAASAEIDVGRRLAPYTAYRIGGPTDIWVAPRKEADIHMCVRLAHSHRIPLFVLGRGSNVLISDSGWRGITLYLGENFSGWTISERTVEVRSGSLLNDLVTATVNAGLAGIELLAGIPGGLGGALRMNAGAFGQEIASVVEGVHGIRTGGEPFSVEGRHIDFGYRRAAVLDHVVITRARLRFELQDPTLLRRRVADILEMRARKQPLDSPSCGSVFKRPSGYYAGALIEEAGLKGKRIGGAEVSQKHAGFILNTADARAEDVYRLIKHIEQKVKDRFGVGLEREVKLVGEFGIARRCPTGRSPDDT
jgi:UDP-N-acetylmuramate dehydrogenase